MKSDTLQPYYRIFYVIALLAVAGILMFSIADAQTPYDGTTPDTTSGVTSTTETTTDQGVPGENTPAPMVVDISSDGTALVRGTVTQAGADSITIESWGGTWTVRMSDGGSVVPPGTGGSNDASAIQVGHFVGAEGTASQGAGNTIDATFVRDWTTDPYTGPDISTLSSTDTMSTGVLLPSQSPSSGGTGTANTNTDINDDTNETEDMDEPGDIDTTDEEDADTGDNAGNDTESSWSGTVDTVRDDSFTLRTDNGTRYTVDVSDINDTDFVDEDGDAIDIGDIDEDDDVTVEGTYNGVEISPSHVEVDTGLF